jgi:hypothetical protein
VAIILTAAVVNSTATQHPVTTAVGLTKDARDGDDLGCVTLLSLEFEARVSASQNR